MSSRDVILSSTDRRTFLGIVAGTAAVTLANRATIPTHQFPNVVVPESYASFDPSNAHIAINWAVDEVLRLGGGIVRLGTQTTQVYTIRATIVVKSGVTLEGISRSIQILNASTAQHQRVELRNNGTVRSLRVTGTTSNYTRNNGIEVTEEGSNMGQSGWTIDNVEVDAHKGDGIIAQQGSANAVINNCYSHDNGLAGIQIIHRAIAKQQNITVSNNVCERNGYNGIDCNGSFCTIRGNTCRYNGQTSDSTPDKNGILVTSVLGVPVEGTVVENNTSENNVRCGIFVGGDQLNGNRATFNTCRGNLESGVMIEALKNQSNLNITVSDNTSDNNGRWGYYMATGGGDPINCCGTVTFAEFKRNKACGNSEGQYLVSPAPDSTNLVCGNPCC